MTYAASFRGFGSELVVPASQEASARAEIASIIQQNDAAMAKYRKAMADYKAAVQARDRALKEAVLQDTAFAIAMGKHAAEAARINQQNQNTKLAFNQAYATWESKKRAYDLVLAQRNAIAANQTARNDAVARQVNLPQGYNGGCITQAQKDAWALSCQQQMKKASAVRGLGYMGLGAANPTECYWKDLPLCVAMPPLPALPNQPIAPALPQVPPPPQPKAAIKIPALPAEPKAPALKAVPTIVVRSDSPINRPLSPQDSDPKSFAVAGLLALVIVGGGAAYYFTHRKKKAAA